MAPFKTKHCTFAIQSNACGSSPISIRYQMQQLTWTLVSCSLVVFQMKYAINNIFYGLFWFLLPVSLVVCNDTTAYFCGQIFGRSCIHQHSIYVLVIVFSTMDFRLDFLALDQRTVGGRVRREAGRKTYYMCLYIYIERERERMRCARGPPPPCQLVGRHEQRGRTP